MAKLQDLTAETNRLLGGQFFNPQTGLQQYTPPAISPESLTPQKLVPTPTPTPTTDYKSIIQSAQIPETPAGDTIAKTDVPAEIKAPQSTADATGLLSSIARLLGQTQGKEAYSAQQLQASGANELAKRQRELTAEMTKLNNDTQARVLQAEQRGGEVGAYTGELNRGIQEIQRNAAIKSLALNSEYAMVSGSLATAQDTAKRAVDLQYGDIEKQIDANTKLLELYKPFMTAEQNERAEARRLANEEKKAILSEKKKLQQDVVNFAQTQGDTKTASQAMLLDPSSDTFQADLARLQGSVRIKPTAPNAGNVITLQERLKLETDLRKEFNSLEEVKRFNKSRDFFTTAQQAYNLSKTTKGSKSPADQQLINAFNKAIDADSVVREGEYERTTAGASLINRIRAKAGNIYDGGVLAQGERDAVMQAITEMEKGQVERYNELRNQYSGYLSDFGGETSKLPPARSPAIKEVNQSMVNQGTQTKVDLSKINWKL